MAEVGRVSRRVKRDGNGYPDCTKCWGNGIVAQTTLGRPFPDARTEPCPQCGGSKRGPYDHTLTDDVRLGGVIAGLTLASKAIRDAVKLASPRTVERQPLDGEEHVGHWLTRAEVYDAVQAASTIERIYRDLGLRVSAITDANAPDEPRALGAEGPT